MKNTRQVVGYANLIRLWATGARAQTRVTAMPYLVADAATWVSRLFTKETKTMIDFEILNEGSANGCSRWGDLTVPPALFVKTFGPGVSLNGNGDGKVDRKWYFKHPENGQLVVVWAYKATSEYYAGLPSPEEFWASNTPFTLSVAAQEGGIVVEDFVRWALYKLDT